MLYAILAYHDEKLIKALSEDQRTALMGELMKAHDKINAAGQLGPAARLDFTETAVTLRDGPDSPVIDGPFAETKEQLLGLYVVDVDRHEDAVEAARLLRRVNKTAIYEIRPITLYLPGQAVDGP